MLIEFGFVYNALNRLVTFDNSSQHAFTYIIDFQQLQLSLRDDVVGYSIKGCCFFLTKLLSAVIQQLLRQLKDLKYLLLVSREQGNSFFFFLVQSIKFYCVLSKTKLEDASYVWVYVCHDGLKEIKKCPPHTSLFKANSRMSLQQLLYSIWIVLQMQREIFGATGKCM